MSDTATADPKATEQKTGDAKPYAGSFIWYELMTDDEDAAIAFYRKVVGWNAAEYPNAEIGDFRYTILSGGDRGVAGLMGLTEEMKAHGARPGWLGVIGVDDVDATAARIAAIGGTVLKQPDDIPTVGRFALVADPGGAVFELLAPEPMESEPPPLDPATPGKTGWHELYSGNGEKAAFDFYSGLFGWKTETEMDMGAMGKYRIFSKDGVQIGGMMDRPANMPVSAWAFYFNVEGIDAAIERIKAEGGQVLMGPHEVPGGSWVVQAVDPQGAHFALVSPTR